MSGPPLGRPAPRGDRRPRGHNARGLVSGACARQTRPGCASCRWAQSPGFQRASRPFLSSAAGARPPDCPWVRVWVRRTGDGTEEVRAVQGRTEPRGTAAASGGACAGSGLQRRLRGTLGPAGPDSRLQCHRPARGSLPGGQQRRPGGLAPPLRLRPGDQGPARQLQPGTPARLLRPPSGHPSRGPSGPCTTVGPEATMWRDCSDRDVPGAQAWVSPAGCPVGDDPATATPDSQCGHPAQRPRAAPCPPDVGTKWGRSTQIRRTPEAVCPRYPGCALQPRARAFGGAGEFGLREMMRWALAWCDQRRYRQRRQSRAAWGRGGVGAWPRPSARPQGR